MDKKYIDRVKIYLNNACTPIAECHFLDGDISKIYWTNTQDRNKILEYTDGYTLFYDERPKQEWT